MGCCESCFGGGSSEYEEIPSQENAALLNKTSSANVSIITYYFVSNCYSILCVLLHAGH